MAKYTKEEIANWVTSYHSSGTTLTQYCEDKPFSRASLHKWIRKQADFASKDNSSKRSFISVELPSMATHSPKGIIRWSNGLEIKLYEPLCERILLKLVTHSK